MSRHPPEHLVRLRYIHRELVQKLTKPAREHGNHVLGVPAPKNRESLVLDASPT